MRTKPTECGPSPHIEHRADIVGQAHNIEARGSPGLTLQSLTGPGLLPGFEPCLFGTGSIAMHMHMIHVQFAVHAYIHVGMGAWVHGWRGMQVWCVPRPRPPPLPLLLCLLPPPFQLSANVQKNAFFLMRKAQIA